MFDKTKETKSNEQSETWNEKKMQEVQGNWKGTQEKVARESSRVYVIKS